MENKEKNFYRLCPECKLEIWYKTKITFLKGNEKKSLCNSCLKKGERNPFYGKIHTEKSVEKIKSRDNSYMQMPEYKEKYNTGLDIRNTNKKPVYECWLEKYGQEEADKKMIELKKKHSHNNSGEKNNMYGKPSPNGSGNGWSGWYKNWRFRSILELSFMINYIEKNNFKWESAEKKKFMIPYIDENGQNRNYFPDFYLEDKKQIIECKPIKLFNTVRSKIKKEVAEKFCLENNLTYKIIDIERLSDDKMKQLYLNNEIKFIERYDKKWRDRFLK